MNRIIYIRKRYGERDITNLELNCYERDQSKLKREMRLI